MAEATNGWDLAVWNGLGAAGKRAPKTSRMRVLSTGAMPMLCLICALQPGILINDRTNAPADFRSREGDGALGDFENRYPWELCTTITEGAWGYQPNAKVKPLASLIQLLVGAAGRDGNFLFNVGTAP